MPPRPRLREVADLAPAPCNNGVPQAEATMALARGLERLAESLESIAEPIVQVGNAAHALSDAQQKLCAFIVGHRLKLAASIPVVLVGVGAISPNAAKVISAILHVWGVPT